MFITRESLAASQATLCIFLSIHAIKEIAQVLVRHYGVTCPAAVVYRASWPDQAVVRGTLADIATRTLDAGIGRTALLLVGWALAAPSTTSKLYDRDFAHGYRPRSAQ